MAAPDVTVIMPVCAWPDANDMSGAPHPQLRAALDSVSAAAPGVRVELLVGVDGPASRVTDAALAWSRTAPEHVDTRVVAFEKQPACTFGNHQRNRLLGTATGRLIAWQDQDDQFFPGALTGVVSLARQHPGKPLIFKMQVCSDRNGSPPRVLWEERGRVERHRIGGHMLVVPNEPALLGRWEPETMYSADFDFISETLKRFASVGHEPVWSDMFISNLRPHTMGGL